MQMWAVESKQIGIIEALSREYLNTGYEHIYTDHAEEAIVVEHKASKTLAKTGINCNR